MYAALKLWTLMC